MMLFALLLATVQPAEDPAAFVRRAYAGYRHQGYSPLKKPERLFSPTLTTEIQKDGSGGEVGHLDGDPLCDCQDFKRITPRILSIQRPSGRAANVRLLVDLGFDKPRNLKLILTLTRSGWRIADIVDPSGHSLLKELQRSNAGK
jgi:hypothetical protein